MIARRELASAYAIAAIQKTLKHNVPGHSAQTILRSIFFHQTILSVPELHRISLIELAPNKGRGLLPPVGNLTLP